MSIPIKVIAPVDSAGMRGAVQQAIKERSSMFQGCTILMSRLDQEARISSGNYPRTRKAAGDGFDEIKRLRGRLAELEILIKEYDPANSDWGFRRSVMLDVLKDAAR